MCEFINYSLLMIWEKEIKKIEKKRIRNDGKKKYSLRLKIIVYLSYCFSFIISLFIEFYLT